MTSKTVALETDSPREQGAILPDTDGNSPPLAAIQAMSLSPIERLKPYTGNARTHSRKQIRQIAESIKRFGFTNPVLVDDNGGIIAGHGRVEAAKLLGLAAIPTVKLSHLSDAEKRAYVIADNKLAQNAGWDREILAIELQGLIDLDFDIDLTGFEIPEIDLVLEDVESAKAEESGPEDAIPEPGAAPCVTRPGDIWVLGKHRIICGSALDATNYAHLLGDEKAEFVFTDPPYNVKIDGNVCGKGAVKHREFAMASGEMTKESFVEFLATVFGHLAAHSVDGSIHDICMDWRHIEEMMAAGNQAYSDLKNVCVWAKNNAGMGTFYRSQHELVFIWKSGKAPHINNFHLGQHGRSRTNVWRYAGITSMSADRSAQLAMHPTVKPVALVVDAIKDCSRRNGLVLDPFLGSGTTVIAAERTGRCARGVELDPVYVDVGIRRWQDYTGKAAILAATRQTFEAVAEERAVSEVCSAEPAPTDLREAA